MTDFRALCAELVDALDNAIRVIHHEDGTLHISAAEPVLDRARAALGGAPSPLPEIKVGQRWQPIDTAPKDGTEILASDYDAIEIVSWAAPRFNLIPGDWVNRDSHVMFPAWWQPLADHPPMPTVESD